MRRLEALHQRRVRRRGQEFHALRVARERHEQLRRDYLLLWQECQNRRTELIRAQRDQAARMIALEQFRQELLGRVDDTPGADKRLERLRRRNLARIQTEERDLAREREALLAEIKRLDDRARLLDEDDEALAAEWEAWARQVAEAEERQTASDALEQHRAHELGHWKLIHEQDERQLNALREEVERIARLLLDEAETAPPANRAA